jgi:hypothetical protein
MDNRVDVIKALTDDGKMSTILVYPATEVVNDPYEKTKTESFLNPLPIKAYVTELSFSSLKWKYTGQVPAGSVQILCYNKYETLLKTAFKIKIGDNFYKCIKDDAKNFLILRRDDHLVVILGLKND